jgi:hypothetical protein
MSSTRKAHVCKLQRKKDVVDIPLAPKRSQYSVNEVHDSVCCEAKASKKMRRDCGILSMVHFDEPLKSR